VAASLDPRYRGGDNLCPGKKRQIAKRWDWAAIAGPAASGIGCNPAGICRSLFGSFPPNSADSGYRREGRHRGQIGSSLVPGLNGGYRIRNAAVPDDGDF
jgi:hypothetical protein